MEFFHARQQREFFGAALAAHPALFSKFVTNGCQLISCSSDSHGGASLAFSNLRSRGWHKSRQPDFTSSRQMCAPACERSFLSFVRQIICCPLSNVFPLHRRMLSRHLSG